MNTPPAADKPFAPACERNAEPIAAQLQPYLPGRKTLLEIGSGTGQHAAALAGRWPQLQWQTSDVAAQLSRPRTETPESEDSEGEREPVWAVQRLDGRVEQSRWAVQTIKQKGESWETEMKMRAPFCNFRHQLPIRQIMPLLSTS